MQNRGFVNFFRIASLIAGVIMLGSALASVLTVYFATGFFLDSSGTIYLGIALNELAIGASALAASFLVQAKKFIASIVLIGLSALLTIWSYINLITQGVMLYPPLLLSFDFSYLGIIFSRESVNGYLIIFEFFRGISLYLIVVLAVLAIFRFPKEKSIPELEEGNQVQKLSKVFLILGMIGTILILGVIFFYLGNSTVDRYGDFLGYGIHLDGERINFTLFSIGALLVWSWLASLIANYANSKGRSWQAFFWLSFLANPLIMWIIAAAISPLPGSRKYVATPVITTRSTSNDSAAEIKKLGKLRDQGLITNAEFEAKKKELLDRI